MTVRSSRPKRQSPVRRIPGKAAEENPYHAKYPRGTAADRQELLTELNALCLSIAEDECRCTYAEGVRFGIDLMVEIHGKDKTAPVILPRLDK